MLIFYIYKLATLGLLGRGRQLAGGGIRDFKWIILVTKRYLILGGYYPFKIDQIRKRKSWMWILYTFYYNATISLNVFPTLFPFFVTSRESPIWNAFSIYTSALTSDFFLISLLPWLYNISSSSFLKIIPSIRYTSSTFIKGYIKLATSIMSTGNLHLTRLRLEKKPCVVTAVQPSRCHHKARTSQGCDLQLPHWLCLSKAAGKIANHSHMTPGVLCRL